MNLKFHLLWAILQPLLRVQALLLLASMALAWTTHMNAQAIAFVLLSQLGASGFVVAFSLLVIGGRVPGRWSTVTIGIFGCILINVSLFVSTLSDTGTIQLGVISLQSLLVAGWIILAVLLVQLAHRGWLGLCQRAQPFMPADR